MIDESFAGAFQQRPDDGVGGLISGQRVEVALHGDGGATLAHRGYLHTGPASTEIVLSPVSPRHAQ